MPYRLAEFEAPEHLVGAARALRAAGYARIEAFTPFAIPELAEVLAVPRSRIPHMMFGAGLTGGGLAWLLQWWCNAYDYPLNVGGRPLQSIPAWVPIVFELTVLSASLFGFFALIVSGGMPRLFHPVDRIPGRERGTLDRHLLAIDLADPRFVPGPCLRILEEHHAVRVHDEESAR
jgi:hypothetical protein